MASRVSHNCLC